MRALLLLFLLPLCSAMLDQAYAVKGRLMCGPQPAANVRIKLWEEDSGKQNFSSYNCSVQVRILMIYSILVILTPTVNSDWEEVLLN